MKKLLMLIIGLITFNSCDDKDSKITACIARLQEAGYYNIYPISFEHYIVRKDSSDIYYHYKSDTDYCNEIEDGKLIKIE